jgi:hypothetical protein
VRAGEQPLERLVSEYIGHLPFLWIDVPGPADPTNDRKRIESGIIALLSNHNRSSLRGPSTDWLGHFSVHPAVRGSELWNVDHVDENHDPTFLGLLARYVRRMPAGRGGT